MVDLKKEKEKEMVIDPEELPEGTCHIKKWGKDKVSVCKVDGKIRIFEILKED